MRAVIVEIKDSIAAVLSDDGCIKKVKNNNYMVGQVIQMYEPKLRYTKKLAVFAASAAAFAVFSIGTWAYASPYSYVSLDVNPSIEYTLNRFDRVLHVKAVNDDGEEILKAIDLKDLQHNTIQDALTKTVEQISDAGYFDGETEGGIMIATYGKNPEKAEEMAQDLEQTVENQVAQNGDTVDVEAVSVGTERVEQARELGVTPGKLNLVEKLKAAASDSESVDLEEWLSKPVKDIMKATKDFRKSETEEASEQETPAAKQQSASLQNDTSEENQTEAQDNAKQNQDKEASKDQKASDKADQKDQKASDKADQKDQKASAATNQKDRNDSGKADQNNNKNQDTSVQNQNISTDSSDSKNNNSDDKNKSEDKSNKSNKSSKETKNQPGDHDQSVLDASAQNGTGNKDSSGNVIQNGQDNTYDQQKESDQKKIDNGIPSKSNNGKAEDNAAVSNGSVSDNSGRGSSKDETAQNADNASGNESADSDSSNSGDN